MRRNRFCARGQSPRPALAAASEGAPRPPLRSGRRSAGWCSGAPAGGARPVAAGAPSRSTTSSSAPRGARTSSSTGSWRSVRHATRRRMPPTRAAAWSSSRSARGASPARSPEGLISGRSARSPGPSMARAPGAPRSRGTPGAQSGDDPEMTARRVIVDLNASGQVARMNAGWLVTRPPGSRPTLQRFWEPCVRTARRPIWLSSSTVAVSSCLSRDESLLPCAIVGPVRQ
jgi:hypothetical protein